jgi:hypothetical protein
MTTLTDKYVAATLRRVPEKQRPEISRELRAAIADDVDGRLHDGATPAEAEFAALTQLGDPYRLAASYTNRPLALIGPDLYPAWVRSLKVVCLTSLPVVFVVLVVISIAQGHNVWAAIFGPLGSIVSVGIYIAFTVTLLFAIAERIWTSDRRARLEWTPDSLATEIDPPDLTRWGDVIAHVVGSLVVAGLLLLDRYSPVVTGKHGRIPVIDPALWSFWVPLFLVLLGLGIVLELVTFRLGRWTIGTAILRMIVGTVGAAAVIVAVLTTTVVNPQLTRDASLQAGGWIWWIVAIVVGCVWLGTTINLWRPSTRTPKPAAV